uniref:Uncharacterized protein n=1 Tax=Magallana gigas TaxID=29159 RepID=A0A8W8K1V1_MAGGI
MMMSDPPPPNDIETTYDDIIIRQYPQVLPRLLCPKLDIYQVDKDPEPLVDRLKTTRKIVTSAMRHGIACEEIKCPVNPLANCMYLKRHGNGYHLKDTYKYYYMYQMITQMAVTGLEWCHFFAWTPEECHLELLRFNADIWQDMKEKIDLFFFNHI